MARAKVKLKTASRLYTRGRVFYNDRWTVITDDKEIESFRNNPSFELLDLKVAEMAKPEPKPKDDFLVFDEPEAPKPLKYHDLSAMRKGDLHQLAYEMGVETEEDFKKKDLIKAIMDKQEASDESTS